jgi:prepilin-type N-terminal cleavage/methylation domain-containing protein
MSFGFTLLELMVVLTLLAAVISLAAPRLAGFFAGRDVREEARRLLSLTRWARSEAISRGERLQVWFDPMGAAYGVRGDGLDPYEQGPNVEYACADQITLNVDPEILDAEGLASILYWPDGAIDIESIDRREIWEQGEPALALVRADTGHEYLLEDLRSGVTR